MHRYTLRDDLSFCRIGERLVFLDVGNDRYFRLPSAQEHSLLAYLAQDPVSEPEIDDLVERGLLVERSQATAGPQPSVMPVARSAMEMSIPAQRPHLSDKLEVLALVLSTRLVLKRSPLSRVLGSLSAGAQRKRAQQSSVAPLDNGSLTRHRSSGTHACGCRSRCAACSIRSRWPDSCVGASSMPRLSSASHSIRFRRIAGYRRAIWS